MDNERSNQSCQAPNPEGIPNFFTGPFALISAFHTAFTAEENRKNHMDLKHDIHRSGFGMVELELYWETTDGEVQENVLLVPKIDLKKAVELGVQYGQFAIIYTDGSTFRLVCTNDACADMKKVRVGSVFETLPNTLSSEDNLKNLLSDLLEKSIYPQRDWRLKEAYRIERSALPVGRLAEHKLRWI